MHPLLKRQLKRFVGEAATDIETLPTPWREFVLAVGDAYEASEADRQLSERSMEIASEELSERNELLLHKNEELKQVEKTIRTSEIRFRTLVEGMGVIAWEYDLTTDAFVFLSPKVYDLGFSMEECLAPGFLQKHVHPDDLELSIKARSSKPTRSQYRFIRADGATIWMDDICASDGSEAGQSVIRGLLLDITERKHMELHHSQSLRLESIGQPAAGIAHEINTPTQYVSDNIRFLKDQFSDLMAVVEKYAEMLDPSRCSMSWSDRLKAVTETINRVDFGFLKNEIPAAISQSLEGLDRVSSIVLAMRDFSHPGSTIKEPADLNRSILSTIEVCRNRWKYVATLETCLADNLPRVPCLIAEFNQVILNLVVNAADAIGDNPGPGSTIKGAIRVSTQLEDGYIKISVEDNGPGMPEAVQRRLFEPFYTTKPVGKGTGQGLAISRDVIVNKHRGRLTFNSTVGKGTTFTIYLPLENDAGVRHEAA